MSDFKMFVNEHVVRKINIGMSGADLYELENSRIAKHVLLKTLDSEDQREKCVREYLFYKEFSSAGYPFLPEIYHCSHSADEIKLIMKRYVPLDRADFDRATLDKIMGVLADIHTIPVPDFLEQGILQKPDISRNDIERALNGWLDVISEHGNRFSSAAICRIAESFSEICVKVQPGKPVLCHGDFHFDNLLRGDDGNVVVCDWQSVGPGHAAGDIAFFLSRLAADGLTVDKETAVNSYCMSAGRRFNADDIRANMSLSNLHTSFMFWHIYLHGSSADRVERIWSDMIADFEYLSAI